ncbi:UvrD-helicase domain-containing protein [Piscinibacter sp.]|uniref:UvrD-helicase domain-containing protein n=1 Tax=Piscinibacter sp. TaxID=1903157 RepID=UPI0039E3AA30
MSPTPAYRADGRPVSREAFYALACDPRRSVVVEACAGAGKTWMLVSRIVRALLAGAQPQEILAITFTKKAAGEMRERLAEWLQAFAAPATSEARRIAELVARGVPPAEAPAWADALAGLQRRVLDSGRAVEVRTFHAWFAQLLRAAPYELLAEIGLDPAGELLLDIADHRGEVMRRFHAALLRDAARREDHAALLRTRGRHQADKWFGVVLERRVELALADRAGVLDDSVPPAVPAGAPAPIEEVGGAAWRDDLLGLAARLAASDKKTCRDAGAGVQQALELAGAEARFAALWSALFTKSGTPRKLAGIAGLDETTRALEAIAARQHQHDSHLEHARLVRLARVLLTEYAGYKRERGLLDMNDLEHGALALLRDAALSGWVQERLDARIRHVLIDEFQDTSPLQWHALHAWLGAYAGAGGGASGQNAPALFVVGDPKQSIYRFRRAEPRVFGAVREFVGQALGGCVLECDHTRRNAPGVLAALNAVFEAAQAQGAFDSFRAHTTEAGADDAPALFALPRVPRPVAQEDGEGDAADAPQAWRDSLTQPRREPEAQRREAEARLVAEAIVRQLDAGLAPRQLMVMARKRAPLRLLAEALQRRHVPCVAVDDATLIEAAEAQDLVAVLDALVSPQHRLSLARALRCPLFDASDAELLALARRAEAGHAGDWWAALVADTDAGAALARARRLLAAWQQASRRLPPHDLLDRIVAEGELRERLAARVPAARRAVALATVDAVLAQSLALDGGRYATPYAFVRALRRRTITVPAPDLGGAVRLLTVHGAKGLEADVVFVMDAQPEPSRAETATLLVDWPVQASAPRRCAFIYKESEVPPALADAMAEERRAREREELNGLYVAMTRARRTLVFSATAPHGASAGSWWQRIEPLAVPWPRPGDGGVAARPEPAPQVIGLPRWSAAPAAPPAPPERDDSPAARLGSAVHRVLEWHTGAGGELAALAAGAAAEFGAPAGEVARIAGRILANPASARFFDAAALRWAANEVPVSLDGAVLRIDRLVRLDEDGVDTWWVLDYKLHHRPEALPAYHAQLAAYRAAVQRAQPGARVRSALIAGDGRFIESA